MRYRMICILICVIAAIAAFSCTGFSRNTGSAASAGSVPKGAPGYARLLGVTIGWSTTRSLEARIGQGRVQVGGHSDSGRYWHFRKYDIHSDAFERRGNNEMIDLFMVTSNGKGRLSASYPFSRDKRWPLRDLVFGESMSSCEAKLRRAGIAMTHTRIGLERVDVRKLRVGKLTYYQRYTLSIAGGKYLSQIVIEAGPTNGTVATPLAADHM